MGTTSCRTWEGEERSPQAGEERQAPSPLGRGDSAAVPSPLEGGSEWLAARGGSVIPSHLAGERRGQVPSPLGAGRERRIGEREPAKPEAPTFDGGMKDEVANPSPLEGKKRRWDREERLTASTSPGRERGD